MRKPRDDEKIACPKSPNEYRTPKKVFDSGESGVLADHSHGWPPYGGGKCDYSGLPQKIHHKPKAVTEPKPNTQPNTQKTQGKP